MDTPTGMQVVERRQEQAAEEARSRPAQAGIQWFRQYIPARAGMTICSAALKVVLAILIAGG